MPIPNLTSGKVVATPTLTSWSQAYIAGGFFVAFSLSLEKEDEAIHLHIVGKQCLNDLEAEFFALEEKNLASIKTALLHIIDQLPKEITVSASIGFVKNDILYLFLYGAGGILFLRRGDFASLLSESEPGKNLQTASGTLQHNDVFVVATGQFEKIIPQETIKNALLEQTIDETTETLSPLVHGVTEGGAAAIFVSYTAHEETTPERFVEEPQEDEEIMEEADQPTNPIAVATPISPPILQNEEDTIPKRQHVPEEKHLGIKNTLKNFFHAFPLPKTKLSHQRKIILTIAVALVFVLFASIILKNQNEQDKKTKILFTEYYEPAKKHYDDGQGLLTLNAALARDELETAKKLLGDAKGKLPGNSPEEKKRLTLLAEVEKSLEQVSGVKTTPLTSVSNDQSTLLSLLAASSDRLYASKEDAKTYYLTTKEIADSDQKTVVKNDNAWAAPAGLGAFGGNLYVLDKKEGVLKFVPSGSDYAKSSYFKGATPDLKDATDMGIDSSIYILKTDGSIFKYTRGTPDSFKVSGLEKSLNKPTRIFTAEDFSYVYVLDRGNSRIVKLNKDGAYQAQYQAGQLSKAQAIDISEKDKKAYILIDKKIYEMQLD